MKIRLSRLTTCSYDQIILFSYVALMLGSALSAYSFGPVPIQWISQIGFIVVIACVALTRPVYVVPGSLSLFGLFLWAVLITSLNAVLRDYEKWMPSLATTSYQVFISLRFLAILSFIAALYLIYWLLVKGYKDFVVKWTVTLGTIISVTSIYFYVAQIHGLPELARTRLGTGGGAQSVVFSYAFHRALGTFREPSLLAEWLIVPFFLSLLCRKGSLNLHTLSIGSALLLTGSMGGLVGVSVGFLAAFLVTNPFKLSNLKTASRLATLLLLSSIVFSGIAVSNIGGTKSLSRVAYERLAPIILEEGMKSSNRDYVYEYLHDVPFPLFGPGLGHANFLFGHYAGSDLVVSLASLYFNIFLSTGVIGLLFLCLFLFTPVNQVLEATNSRQPSDMLLLLSAYLALLVIFAVTSEEFTTMFAVACALLIHEIRRQKQCLPTHV